MEIIERSLPGALLCVLLSAWNGVVVAARQEPDPDQASLVVNLLSERDKDMRALGLEYVRTQAKGPEATRRFAGLLPTLAPDAQVGLLRALADRGDSAARTDVQTLLSQSQEPAVRVAAIAALGPLGLPDDVPILVRLLGQTDPQERAAARASLIRLPGQGAATGIAAAMKRADLPVQLTLIDILAARRALETIPDILPAAVDPDPRVRAAAMTALGQIAGPEHLPGMIQGVLKATPGAERAAAEKAVMFVCGRIAQPDQRAPALLSAMARVPKPERTELLSTLGRVGGPAAVKTVNAALADRDPKVRQAGLRALCNWPDASVAPHLLQLARTQPNPQWRIMALRALIRVAPLPDQRTDPQRLNLLKKSMELCTRDQERHLVLQRASAIRSIESLRFVTAYLDRFPEQVCQTVVELAHHRTLREPHKPEFDAILDQVIQISNDPTVVERAHRYKKGQTWARPTAED